MTDAGTEAAPSVRPQRRPLRALTVLTVVLLTLAAISALLAASQLFTTRSYSFSMFDYGGVNVIDVEGMPSSAAAGAGLGWLGLWALPTLILGALGFIALVATLSVRALHGMSRLRSLVVLTAVFLGLGVVGGIATIAVALQPLPKLYGSGSADGVITGFYLSIADGNFYETFPWNSLVPLLLPPTIWLLIIGVVGLLATRTVHRVLRGLVTPSIAVDA